MNFIKDKELALRFQNKAVPSQERVLYLIFSLVFATLMFYFIFIAKVHSDPFNQWDIFSAFLDLIIVILGTIVCYRSNKSGDDQEFIERYICIAFPAGIRAFFVMLPAGLLFYGLIAIFREEGIPNTTSVYDVIWQIIFLGYFYWRLNALIKLASH